MKSYDIDHEKEELAILLEDARDRLIDFIGWDCECDSTHAAVGTQCCLCQYKDALDSYSE